MRRLRILESAALIVFLGGSGLPAVSASPSPVATPGPASTVTCAFSHPSYSGWCRVTGALPSGATAERLCSRVLTCLNDVRCTRTYCNATTIRGGWKLESVQTAPAK